MLMMLSVPLALAITAFIAVLRCAAISRHAWPALNAVGHAF